MTAEDKAEVIYVATGPALRGTLALEAHLRTLPRDVLYGSEVELLRSLATHADANAGPRDLKRCQLP
jgi:hypothetical protein